MVRVTAAVFLLSLAAVALDLSGRWKGANALAIGLFALTLVLVLLLIIGEGDEGMR